MWLPDYSLSYALLAGLVSLVVTVVVMRVGSIQGIGNAEEICVAGKFCSAFGGIGLLFASAIGLWLSELDSILVIGAIVVTAIHWWNNKHALPRRWLYCLLIIPSTVVALSDLVFQKLVLLEYLLYVFCIVLISALFPYLEKRNRHVSGVVFWISGALAISAANAGPNGGEIAALNVCMAAGSFSLLFFNSDWSRFSVGNVAAAPIGFLLAVSALLGLNGKVWSPYFLLLVFLPLVVLAETAAMWSFLRSLKASIGCLDFVGKRLFIYDSNPQQRIARIHLLMASCVFLALLFQQSVDLATLLILIGWGGLFILFRFLAKPSVGPQC